MLGRAERLELEELECALCVCVVVGEERRSSDEARGFDILC